MTYDPQGPQGPHLADEIPRLLTGEASHEAVRAAAAHLRTCVDCQQELVSAVVAHASLTSAHRFAPEMVARPEPGSAGNNDPAPARASLPDLSAVFAQARADAATQEAPARSMSLRRGLLVAATVGGLVIGGGGVALVSNLNSSTSHTASGRTVSLKAFEQGTHSATAKITSNGSMTIDATALPTPAGNKRYEVWLTDSARKDMKPVGWIGTNGKATLTVPANLMTHYTNIEVSVQNVDAPSIDYSGVSVLRGQY